MEALQEGEKVRVYVAGPLTKGDTLKNISTAIAAGETLLNKGFAPFVPHLNTMWEICYPNHPVQDWLELDFQWLRVCHALLRLPGESPGADKEVEFCYDHDIPVLFHVNALEKYFFKTEALICRIG